MQAFEQIALVEERNKTKGESRKMETKKAQAIRFKKTQQLNFTLQLCNFATLIQLNSSSSIYPDYNPHKAFAFL